MDQISRLIKMLPTDSVVLGFQAYKASDQQVSKLVAVVMSPEDFSSYFRLPNVPKLALVVVDEIHLVDTWSSWRPGLREFKDTLLQQQKIYQVSLSFF